MELNASSNYILNEINQLQSSKLTRSIYAGNISRRIKI